MQSIYIYIFFSFLKYNKLWWHWPEQQMESCCDLLQWLRMDQKKKKPLKWVQKYLRGLRLESLCVLISTASTILIKCFHPSCQRKRCSSPFALDMQLWGDVARLYNHDFKEVCGNVSLILIKKSFFLNFFINFRHLLAITFVQWIQWQKLIIHSFCQGKFFKKGQLFNQMQL